MPSTAELAARADSTEAVVAARNAAGSAGIDELYLIGGAVRDLVRGVEPVDIDLAIDDDPQALAEALVAAEGATEHRPLRQETRFGTVTTHRDGVRYDIARTRAERYPHPGALPEVAPAPIEQDLLRRDFTVNAIALGLLGRHAGEVLAAPGAEDDLIARRLAVLHDASFRDDPTRLFRLARYNSRLGFEIAPQTYELAKRAIAGGALATISGTRVGNELRLLAAEPDPLAAFTAAASIGLPWSLDADVASQALTALPPEGRRDLLVLAAVFTGSQNPLSEAPAQTEERAQDEGLASELDRLGFTAGDRQIILEAVTEASALADRVAKAASRSEVAAAVGTAGIETVALASARGEPDRALLWLRELRHQHLEIDGSDLLHHGVEPGPTIGDALAVARNALLDGQASDRESQLAIALAAAQ